MDTPWLSRAAAAIGCGPLVAHRSLHYCSPSTSKPGMGKLLAKASTRERMSASFWLPVALFVSDRTGHDRTGSRAQEVKNCKELVDVTCIQQHRPCSVVITINHVCSDTLRPPTNHSTNRLLTHPVCP